VLVAFFALPYVVGEALVGVLDDAGKLHGAFDDPPNSSADLLDPTRWLEPVDRIELEAPPLGDGEVPWGDDETLGAHALYLMLATVLEPAEALDAVSGWGGDSVRFFDTDDGTRCLRVAIAGVSAPATDELRDAMEAWAASRPDGAASAQAVGDHIQLEACDRGTAAATLTTDLTNVPGVRARLVTVLTASGADIDTATCVATRVIDVVPFALLTQAELSKLEQQRVRGAFAYAAAACSAKR
jgi:hypothetical protein